MSHLEKYVNIIQNMKHILETDKEIMIKYLYEQKCSEYEQKCGIATFYEKLSFFSKRFITKNIDNYEYIQTLENENIYVTTSFCGGGFDQIILDSEKKIIFFSKWWFNHYFEFIEHINHFFITTYDKLDFQNAYYIGNNVIAIQKWFVTYGHVMDELFNLYDFYEKKLEKEKEKGEKKVNKDYKIMNSFINTYNSKHHNNKIISKLLFGDLFINNDIIHKIPLLRIQNLFLIKHTLFHNTFQHFPENAKNKIINSVFLDRPIVTSQYKSCFITRNKNKEIKERNINNFVQIETYFQNKSNFLFMNPENEPIQCLIENIYDKDLIVLTWGGALVNLIYAKKGAHVIILKSKGYDKENGHHLRHIFKHFKITIIFHENNEVALDRIEKVIDSINEKDNINNIKIK